MRTALIRSGALLVNLNQVLYGKVEQEGSNWKALVVFREGKSCWWVFTTKDAAFAKLDELVLKSNEIALTEVLG